MWEKEFPQKNIKRKKRDVLIFNFRSFHMDRLSRIDSNVQDTTSKNTCVLRMMLEIYRMICSTFHQLKENPNNSYIDLFEVDKVTSFEVIRFNFQKFRLRAQFFRQTYDIKLYDGISTTLL